MNTANKESIYHKFNLIKRKQRKCLYINSVIITQSCWLMLMINVMTKKKRMTVTMMTSLM